MDAVGGWKRTRATKGMMSEAKWSAIRQKRQKRDIVDMVSHALTHLWSLYPWKSGLLLHERGTERGSEGVQPRLLSGV